MQLNRVVALATPLFAAAAGWVATLVADNVPGVSMDDNALEEVFIAGALIALVPAVLWLLGWQRWEARTAEAQQATELAVITSTEIDTTEDASVYDEDGDFDEIEDMDDLDDLDELDEGLAEDEEPARTGG